MLQASSGDAKAIVSVLIEENYRTPIMISLIGAKAAVNQMMARAMLKYNQGPKASSHAFTISGKNSTGYESGFTLPHDNYRRIMPIRLGKTHLYEGRIIHKDADQNTSNMQDTCYVLVREKIEFGKQDFEARELEWVDFVQHARAPEYPRPLWCEDLYRIFVALKNRLSIPVHPTWMPYLFKSAPSWMMQWYPGHVSPELYEVNAQPRIETGAYKLVCDAADRNWRTYITNNPNRAKHIKF